MEEDKYGHYQYFEIFRTSYKERNQDGNICDDGEGPHKTTQSVKDCIERFIDCELKCHIPWHTSERKEEHADCTSDEEFERYVFLSNRLSSLDSRDMEQATGCMRRCDRMEYKLWETTPLGMKAKYKPEWLTLSFIFSSGGLNVEICSNYASRPFIEDVHKIFVFFDTSLSIFVTAPQY